MIGHWKCFVSHHKHENNASVRRNENARGKPAALWSSGGALSVLLWTLGDGAVSTVRDERPSRPQGGWAGGRGEGQKVWTSRAQLRAREGLRAKLRLQA